MDQKKKTITFLGHLKSITLPSKQQQQKIYWIRLNGLPFAPYLKPVLTNGNAICLFFLQRNKCRVPFRIESIWCYTMCPLLSPSSRHETLLSIAVNDSHSFLYWHTRRQLLSCTNTHDSLEETVDIKSSHCLFTFVQYYILFYLCHSYLWTTHIFSISLNVPVLSNVSQSFGKMFLCLMINLATSS